MAGHVVAMGGGGFLAGDPSSPLDDLEACVTDSFSADLDGLEDGLGLLPGSFCPHYDGEERRRPVYRRLVREGFPAGIACDDGAAAVYRGAALVEIVTDRPGARAFHVTPDGEEPIETRLLR